MEQKILESAKSFLESKLNGWCDRIENDITDEKDFEVALESICEKARSFGASLLELSNFLYYIDADRIEGIIEKQKEEQSFSVSKTKELGDSLKAEWVLQKEIHGKMSELIIQLAPENYIRVYSLTEDWNLFVFGYQALESAIVFWAEGSKF